MNYKTILSEQLLSTSNIDFLINTILANFKISTKAVSKCVNIITGNMIKYIDLIEKYPESSSQLIEAVNFLNKKCYDDFTAYLLTKYPNGNILRNNIPAHFNLPPQVPIQPLPVTNYYPLPTYYPTNQTIQQPPYDEIIILTEEEKNELIKKYDLSNLTKAKHQPATPDNTKTNEFLSYLTNPLVLQMFNMMVNQMNLSNEKQNNKPKEKNTEIVIDQILDMEQVQALVAKSNKELVNSKLSGKELANPKSSTNNKNIVITKKITSVPKSQSIKKLDVDSVDSLDSDNNSNDNEEELIIDDNNKQTDEEMDQPVNDDTETTIDLANLNNESVIIIGERIKELVNLKNKYLRENNKKMIKLIDKEKNTIVNALNAHKQKIKKEAKENENKINGITLSNTKDTNYQNTDRLDLQFDPTNDYNDLKNIVIGFKTDSKITEISLVNYYLPFNANNVTRFNNKFIVYFNNKVNKIIIPPGKYEINVLLDAIKSQANFLDFTINEKNKIITIKNTMGMKFELMVDSDTIFPLLGFTGKATSYKDKLFYEAFQPYNLETNQKVLLSLSGSTKDPTELEFDNQVTPTQPIILKKVARGISMKQMMLILTNGIGQYYDFIMPFKMCLRITYAE